MFKNGQKVVFVEGADVDAGTKGVIVEVDEIDKAVPYLVRLTDEDDEIWCCADEVEADGEVIE